ncbi:protein polybromo-1-like isoform X2 [Watersipora subatra]|uniref:protein polybromo-1-like isoform X2 n=1 Tax=Watersipora subatra TaxID=2589382 RepID=UPI00355C4404
MIRVPKRRAAPDYYETIKTPIDLLKIQQKLKTEEYEELEQLTEDMQLLIKNTKAYYGRSSQEHQDANQLWALYTSTKSELIAAAFGEKSPQKADVDSVIQAKCQQLLDAFKKLKNGDRLLCEVFMTLPDKKELPIYYQAIKHPIDLDTITRKLNSSEYDGVEALEQDLNLMLKNAMDFNEPGSTIYKDAETLKLMMSAVMSDITLASPNTNISKLDKRSRRSSAAPADPMDEDTDTDNAEDEDDDADEDNSMLSLGDDLITTGDPYWLLFKAIATHTDDSGKSAAKPFLVLPNRRWFPDYYDDIANPISMTQIKRKIKKRKYNSLNEMAADLNLMFENAKEYNSDDSKIFQNAMEMQAVMWEKKKEIDAGVKLEADELTPSNRKGGSSASKSRPGKGGTKPDDDTASSVKSSSPSRRPKAKGKARSFASDPTERSLKQRLKSIYNSVYDYEDGTGRALITPFIDLPSKDDYPEYYDYITEPIDMTMIMQKISNDKYESEKDLIVDLKLMFNNARSFNEDDSQLYKDAGTLEKVMKRKVMALSIADDPEEDVVKRTFATIHSPLGDKLNDLHETIKVFKDQHQRVLSLPFLRLPSKADAAVLLNEFLKRYECLDDQSQYVVPDVAAQVQKMFHSLYSAAINHADEEGRCYSDSVCEFDQELPTGLTFNTIGMNLKNKRYRRLDKFQEDMFAVCEGVRQLCRSDSQAFEDSIEVQKMFITARDNFCRNGEGAGFSSPAISYTPRNLSKSIEELIAQKQAEESPAESDEVTKRKVPEQYESLVELEKDGKVYKVGDFIYVMAREGSPVPHIMNIHRLWKDSSGAGWIYGSWFYRIAETSHSTIRKFLHQEVFVTHAYDTIPLSSAIGKCYIMYIKDYLCNQPQDFDAADVYVCESKYNKKLKAFHKLKSLSGLVKPMEGVNLISRPIPIVPSRVASPSTADPSSKLAPIPFSNKPIVKELKSVTIEVNDGEQGCTYYEQFVAENGSTYKLGDFVYLSPSALAHSHTSSGPPPIARIEKLFRDPRGWYVFVGTLFLRPEMIEHTPARLFYQREVLLSAAEEKTYNLASVVGKCCVLYSKDFASYRPTEFSEEHIYVCEWKYKKGDGENSTRKLSKGLKAPPVSNQVCEDELCYFPKKISIKRVPSPQLFKLCAESYIQDQEENDSREQSRTPQGHFEPAAQETPRTVPSPVADGATKKKKKKHHVTSFQLFANEIRRGIQDEHPGASFGEVSRLVAARWRGLPDSRIQEYKEKAVKLQNEAKAREAKEAAERSAMEAASRQAPPPTQFNKDMFPQATGQQPIPTQPTHVPQTSGQYLQHAPRMQQVGPGGVMVQGAPMQQVFTPQRPMLITQDGQQWQGGPPSAPLHQQPIYTPQATMPQGVMQFHGQPNVSGSPMHRPSPAQTPDTALTQQGQQPMQVFQMMPVSQPTVIPAQQTSLALPAAPPRPPSPKFVSVDLPPSKIAHSDIYLRYIGGLRGDNPVKISNWERELNPEMIAPPNPNRLPADWLANGPGVHENTLTALHALRDVMVKDAFKLQRAYQL